MADGERLRVEVMFDRRVAEVVRAEEQGSSYCASGYVYLGQMVVWGGDGMPLVDMPVQTGGWMCEDSPFVREGHCPQCVEWGAYQPLSYPDTAFPDLVEDTTLGTQRTGKRQGFRIPDPPGTGRSALMIHPAERCGSEGCISTHAAAAWEVFCDLMERLHSSGIESVPLRVTYACPPPEPGRMPQVSCI